MLSEHDEEFLSLFYDVVHSKTTAITQASSRSKGNRSRRPVTTVKICYQIPSIISPVLPGDVGKHIFNVIKHNYMLLSDAGLGPRVQQVRLTETQLNINMEDLSIKSNLSADKLALTIGEIVANLHRLGYGHGNISLSNIRYKQGKAYLISPEWVYQICSIEDDKIAHYMAFNLHDLNLSNKEEQQHLIDLDYDYWSGELFPTT